MMKKYILFQIIAGLVASLSIDWNAQVSKKAIDPILAMTPMGDDLISAIPVIVLAIFWCVLSFLIAKKFFKDSVISSEISEIKKGSESDKAFGFGLITNTFTLFLYMCFYYLVDSPVRMFLG